MTRGPEYKRILKEELANGEFIRCRFPSWWEYWHPEEERQRQRGELAKQKACRAIPDWKFQIAKTDNRQIPNSISENEMESVNAYV